MPYERSPIQRSGRTSTARPNHDPGHAPAVIAATVSRQATSSAPGKVAVAGAPESTAAGRAETATIPATASTPASGTVCRTAG